MKQTRIVRIDTGAGSAAVEPVPGRYRWHGGRELTSSIINHEVDAATDPLGPENKLVIATGLLAGTIAPNFSRVSIGCKSPLTGGIKESNAGGKAGFLLGQHGIRAIILEGQPAAGTSSIAIIHRDGTVSLEDATSEAFLGTYEITARLVRRFGKGAGMIAIGPAGARKALMASVAILDLQNHPSRHAARGGPGAVMGAKGVKAIVIEKAASPAIACQDEVAFKAVASPWARELKTTKAGFSRLGTAMTVGISQTLQGLPTRNFSRGTFDRADRIGGEALHEIITSRGGRYGIPCMPGCAIQCSNLVPGRDGQHATSSLEYETICLNGSNLDIGDLDDIARIDRACDDAGVDTIEFGGTAGVLMEAGKIPFGDVDAVLGVLDGIARGSEAGRFHGQGVYRVGTALGIDRIPHVKKQGLAAYDPRVYKGMGITMCTSPMGADHTAGAAIYKRPGLKPIEAYGDVFDTTGKLDLSYELQVLNGAMDMLGSCYFIGPTRNTLERAATLLGACHGWEGTWEVLFEKAKAMLTLELAFNERAGITRDANALPAFLASEPSAPSGHAWEFARSDTRDFWDGRT